jgi:Domain of unknown function (DUF4157)
MRVRRTDAPRPPHVSASRVAPALARGAVDRALSSPGEPLQDGTRSWMENRFRADFSDVRVHSGAEAAASARGLGADAYTVGNRIVFGPGRYVPGSDAGRRILAHELAHVIQQRSGAVSGRPAGHAITVSEPGDRFEGAAETTARQVMAAPGTPWPALFPGPAAAGADLPGSRSPGFLQLHASVSNQTASPPARRYGHLAVQRKCGQYKNAKGGNKYEFSYQRSPRRVPVLLAAAKAAAPIVRAHAATAYGAGAADLLTGGEEPSQCQLDKPFGNVRACGGGCPGLMHGA